MDIIRRLMWFVFGVLLMLSAWIFAWGQPNLMPWMLGILVAIIGLGCILRASGMSPDPFTGKVRD